MFACAIDKKMLGVGGPVLGVVFGAVSTPPGGPSSSFTSWVALVGALLLFIALSAVHLQRLPISTAIVYLLVGLALGPAGAGWVNTNVVDVAAPLERLTEIAVVVSLFVAGLKLRLPLRVPHWRAAFLLAGPVMLVCIVGVALVAHYGLGFEPPAALLLGAILAPTDPVLAAAIAVNDASDRDRMRYGLSGEAGLNDGMAFPFVVLALLWHDHGSIGAWIVEWTLHRLVWAIPTALVLGYAAGLGMGRLAITLRNRHRDDQSPNDFFALALIALAYAAAQSIGAWGFLTAFAAGVGLRRAEVAVVKRSPHPQAPTAPDAGLGGEHHESVPHGPAETFVAARADANDLEEPAVAAGVLVSDALSFGHTMERLFEVALIVFVGACVTSHWDPRALVVTLALFCFIRPLAVESILRLAPIRDKQRRLMGWFGIRGIGSLYYLAYALRERQSLVEGAALVELTVSVVAASIVLHGVSSRHLLKRYEHALGSAARTDGGRSSSEP